MTDDIDAQVAEFGRQIDGLAAIDAAQIQADIDNLGRAILGAESHELAAVALRMFVDARPDSPDYARAVIVSTLSHIGLHVILNAPIASFDGDEGLLRRIKRIAYASRGLGIGEWAAGTGVTL